MSEDVNLRLLRGHDLKLKWTPDDLQARPPSTDQRPVGAPESIGPSIFAALQASKIPTEVFRAHGRPSPDREPKPA